ncbi:hypothetical protein L596_030777 [Steinernema carpocapsae]|uniref:Uncharacterized protein n=1 Tax=Steinernema carpocapsae TaxID=34508 RepID=A0A4V5ZWU7_STECR|nr:hypothetical protein L596_030777 [Steinernema carpocapsae]
MPETVNSLAFAALILALSRPTAPRRWQQTKGVPVAVVVVFAVAFVISFASTSLKGRKVPTSSPVPTPLLPLLVFC